MEQKNSYFLLYFCSRLRVLLNLQHRGTCYTCSIVMLLKFYRDIFTVLCCLFFQQANAQYCGKVEYTGRDGLSSPFSISYIAKGGYLWLESRAGINRFDGKEWKNFTTQDGLLFSWSRPMFEDKEGGLWLIHHYGKGASRYVNGEFQQYVMPSPQVDSLLEGQKPFPYYTTALPEMLYDYNKQIPIAWHQDSTHQFWIYEYDYQTQSFDLQGYPFLEDATLKKHHKSLSRYENGAMLMFDRKGDYCVRKTENGKTMLLYPNGDMVNLPVGNYRKKPYVLLPGSSEQFRLIKASNDTLQLWQNGKWRNLPWPTLTRYGKNPKPVNLKFHKFSLQKHAKDSVTLFSVWKVMETGFGNSYILAEHEHQSLAPKTSVMFYEEKAFGNMVKDKAGTYWYMNGKSVIRLFPNQLLIKSGFQNMTHETWAVAQSGVGDVWFASYRNGLAVFDGIYVHKPEGELSKQRNYLTGSQKDSLGNIFFSMDRKGMLKLKDKTNWEILCKKQQGFFLNRNLAGNLMYGTSGKGLWILEGGKDGIEQTDWTKIGLEKGLRLSNVITALQDKQGNYWMGRGSQGLAVYLAQTDTVYNWIKEDDPDNYGVQSMDEDANGNLWLGTDKGLYFFEKNGKTLKDLDLKNELQQVGLEYTDSSMIQVCKRYDEHTLIVGNPKGYFLIDLNAWYAQPRQLKITPITFNTGHQGGEIAQNGVWIDDNKEVWLACTNGAVRYTPKLLPKDSIMPQVYINKVEVGNKVFDKFDEEIRLSTVERTLKIHFRHSFNPTLYNNIRFRYRLNEDTDWSELKEEPYLDLMNISAGDYFFEVMAEKNGIRSKPRSFRFHVASIYYESLAFWISIIILIIVSTLLVVLTMRRFQQRKLELEKAKVELLNISKERDGLLAQTIVGQLNPHFINNILQWLQIRFDDAEDKDGVAVIGRLAENIGAIFKNTRQNKPFHKLKEEIRLVENYLFVQKKRFGSKLSYQIPDVTQLGELGEVDVPLMILQIHVENAVEHGIRNKRKNGMVNISCSDKGKYLQIMVQDDGVGRTAASKYGSSGSGSGTKMLKDLETIYNRKNELEIKQTYEDNIFVDEQGKKYGTRVYLQIPKNHNYKI